MARSRNHGRPRFASLLVVATLVAVCSGCGDELTNPDENDGVISLTLELVSWPDTLRVGEVGTLEVRILDPQGREVSGAHVTWSTSDSEILSVEPIGSGLQARLTARGPGTASVTVRASGERFRTAEESQSLSSLLSGVTISAGTDTVLTAFVEEAVIQARGLDVGGSETEGAGLVWQRSGPGAVELTSLSGSDSARVTAVSSGVDTLVVTHPLCTGACADTMTVEVEWVESVEAAVDSVLLSALVSSEGLGVTGTDRYGNTVDEPGFFEWTSLDPAVAEVSDAGVVTAQASGLTGVVVSKTDVADTVAVEVEWLSSVEAGTDTVLTAVVDSARFTAIASDGNGNEVSSAEDPEFFTWSVHDEQVSTVDAAGLVRAVGAGQTTVLVSAVGVTDSIGVEVEWVSSVQAEANSVLLTAFVSTEEIEVTGTDRYGNTVTRSGHFTWAWSSSDAAVATVQAGDTSGVVTAQGSGFTDVIVSASGAADTVDVEVEWVNSVEAGGDTVLTAVVDSAQLTATASDRFGNSTSDPAFFDWSSEDDLLVSVDDEGVVRPLDEGGTSVVVSASGVADTVGVEVEWVSSVQASADSLLLTAFVTEEELTVSGQDRYGHTVTDSEHFTWTWTSDSTGIATVWTSASDTAAMVTAEERGQTSIIVGTASAADTLFVEVEWVSSVELESDTVLTAIVDSAQLVATASDRLGNSTDDPMFFDWFVVGSGLVWVDEGGVVRAADAGISSVEARAYGVADTVGVEVDWLDSIDAGADTVLTAVVDSAQLMATAFDRLDNSVTSDERPSLFSWVSLADSVATVAPAGLARAAENGHAPVVVSAYDLQDTVGVEVEWVTSADASVDSLLLTAFVNTGEIGVTGTDRYGNAVTDPEFFDWTSVDPAIATVEVVDTAGAGVVSAQGSGLTEIVVSGSEVADTVGVEVEWLSSVTVSDSLVLLSAIRDTGTLTATAVDRHGNSTSDPSFFTWSVVDDRIANVDGGGNVQALKSGHTSLVVAADTFSIESTIDVEWLSSIEAERDSVLLTAIDDTAHLSVTGTDRFGDTTSDPTLFRWISTDLTVAKTDETGVVTAVSGGTSLVIARVETLEDTVPVRVWQTVAEIVIPEPITVFRDDTVQLRAEAIDPNGHLVPDTTLPLVWESLDPAIATVDQGGSAVGLQVGDVSVAVTGDALADTAPAVVSSLSLIGAGGDHNCAVGVDSEGYCWGSNSSGQVGSGDTTEVKSRPTAVSGDHIWAAISPGQWRSCGVTSAADLYCWGYLGWSDERTPVQVAGSHAWDAVSVSVSGSFTCGVTTGRDAYCWDGDEPELVPGGLSWEGLSVGGYHRCGIHTGGHAYCWGSGGVGQLGDSLWTDSTEPVLVHGDHTWRSVTAGWNHSCGVTTDGAAYCWGDNWDGRLGDGTYTSRPAPTLVEGGGEWAALSAGGSHTCGVTTGGEAYCWGSGWSGQLGNGTTTSSSVPVLVSGNHTWESVTAGGLHTCGITTSGHTYCWGSQESGRLGNGMVSSDYQLTPVRVRSPGQPDPDN